MRIYILAALCIISHVTFAQKGVSKGKIIENGRELSGYVNIFMFDKTPQQFSFSEREGGPFRELNPETIQSVELDNGIRYERHFIKVYQISPDYFYRKATDYAPDSEYSGYKFIQKAVSGAYSLYIFSDRFSHRHFFYMHSTDTGLTRLSHNTYVNDSGVIKRDVSFRNDVNFLVQRTGCNAITSAEVEKLKYETTDLIKVFRKINSCAGTPSKDLFSRQNALVPHLEVLAGALRYKNTPGFYGENNWNRSTDPVFGITFLFSPRMQAKGYALGLGVVYHKSEGSSGLVGVNQYSTMVGRYSFERIYVQPLVRLYLSDARFHPIAELGVSIPVVMNSSVVYSNQFSTHTIKGKDKSWMINAGTGVSFSKFSLLLRYGNNIRAIRNQNYFGLTAGARIF